MDFRSTRLFKLWERYEHHFNLAALATGFTFDLMLAKRPDSIADNILLVSYLCIAGVFIIMLNLARARRGPDWEASLVMLVVLQFCFGGLANNLLILYGKSGTFTTSALFILVLVALGLGNEFLRNRYAVLRFNIAVYYLLLLTYLTIAVPSFITHSVGSWTFLFSGFLSLAWIGVFLTILFFSVLRGRDVKSLRGVVLVVGSIYIVFNFLYFFNFIPPVPLSLKGSGIYHSILKESSGDYIALYEAPPWWQFWRDTNATYTLSQGSTAMCFSSVFAPTDLNTPIYHHWQKLNQTSREWETVSRVSFGINGGRAEGYRGYTLTASLTPGSWRCDVETASGQLIGRESFTVVSAPSTPTLSQKTL